MSEKRWHCKPWRWTCSQRAALASTKDGTTGLGGSLAIVTEGGGGGAFILLSLLRSCFTHAPTFCQTHPFPSPTLSQPRNGDYSRGALTAMGPCGISRRRPPSPPPLPSLSNFPERRGNGWCPDKSLAFRGDAIAHLAQFPYNSNRGTQPTFPPPPRFPSDTLPSLRAPLFPSTIADYSSPTICAMTTLARRQQQPIQCLLFLLAPPNCCC